MFARSVFLAGLTVAMLGACTDVTGPDARDLSALAPAYDINPGVCVGPMLPSDCMVAVELYNTTGGPNWNDNTNWGGPNACTWFGVVCTEGGYVQELNLHLNNLTGPLLPQIGNLNHLQGLTLSSNPLTGPIPDEWQNLTQLRRLSLGSVAVNGPIPQWLTGLGMLERLFLFNAGVTGEIPAGIGNLTNLRDLVLSFNGMTGALPPELGNLVNLKSLFMTNNSFTGPLPPELGNLTQLESFGVQHTGVSGPIPAELGNLTQVVNLWLASNQLTGGVPAELAQLTAAEIVHLQGNQLEGLVPLAFAQFGGSLLNCYLWSELEPGNEGLYMPATKAYRDADVDGDGRICNIALSTAEDIGEGTIAEVDDLVPDVLNEGQGNSLKTKLQQAMEKAAQGQYAAAINLAQAFVQQVNAMVSSGQLTAEQAAPLLEQAAFLIQMWTELL
jgi:hypothetical protein